MPGVGPKTRGKLLRNLGSLREVLAATEEQLSRRRGNAAAGGGDQGRARSASPVGADAESAEETAIENAFQSD